MSSRRKTANENPKKPVSQKPKEKTCNPKDESDTVASKGKCKFCGNPIHLKRRDCPAFGQECLKCHKSNHFASVCNARPQNPVNTMEDEDKYEDDSDSDISVLTVESVYSSGQRQGTSFRVNLPHTGRRPH